MDIKQSFSTILNAEVDRKQFLQQVGIGMLAIIGVSRFMKNLGDKSNFMSAPTKSSGYGGQINLRGR